MQSDASRKADLRRGLVPSLPPVGDQTRAALGTEQKAHQQECEEREARWDAELADTLTTAEEVRKRLIRRGTKKLPPGSFKWWEDMETRSKSGWLSREQLAGSEFAKRVAVKHGIGVVAALMKKKEMSTKEASSLPSDQAGAAHGTADDPMDVSDHPIKAENGGGGEGVSALSGGGGSKRPLDPLADENDALQTVRSIRRRLVLSGGESEKSGGGPAAPPDGSVATETSVGGGGGGGSNSSNGGEAGAEGKTARLEINNADLAELLRVSKPKGDPRRWAKVLFRAQNSRKGTHAGGETRRPLGLRC